MVNLDTMASHLAEQVDEAISELDTLRKKLYKR